MDQIKGFIMSLISAAAASALVEGFLPDGGIKKYVKYLTALVILLVLVSPLKELIGAVPSLVSGGELYFDSTDAMARANSVVAMHIEKALCEKFSIDDGDVEVRYEDGRTVVRARGAPWLIESDLTLYIAYNFGVEAEVEFYE